ncbi:MAG: pit accessory protein [Verrucomicrobia bacterium]|nr:pit accessory protein [Verrucomicrobiota bacterium]MBI3868804.1 pit accessory protein [Verrucomicrobiota bacterium]
MFSLQKVMGRDDEFCALLEASATEAVRSVVALKGILLNKCDVSDLEVFQLARRNDKDITSKIGELLNRAIVTSFEREDIEELSQALYKIPKTVEKFAERYLIVVERARGFDFTRQLILLEEATRSVLEMVQAFRCDAGVAEIKRLDTRIQRLESEADDVILDLIGDLYHPEFPSLEAIIIKDLIELNEKVVDRCRDASGVIARLVIKLH